ncbi:hypothetical protein MMC07_008617 [Pseudocyphellaria aurata]|nr:hypothetical protein [Pseudocyphellaria aurata]
MDNHHYQIHSPAARRSSQSVTMAPTASMIDPTLENHRMPNSQMSHDFNSSQMQRSTNTNMLDNQHDLHPMIEHGSDRVLPSIEVNDESLDNAYVDFIMYCNPSIATDVDTSELRKGFRSPPKSDGKNFSPFVLFGLISRLEAKDIKTWTQLVTELGVEHPDPSKNQSTQKVQQYAVRLKRWLHAFHVDAFFHYCLGIPNAYYTDRPVATDPLAESVRDGVPPEEDLALRALLPEWRPKRGRRKAEDADTENTVNKRTQFRRSASADLFSNFDEQYATHPQSAVPWSGHPQQADAWTAAQVAIAPKAQNTTPTPTLQHLSTQSTGQQIRWRLNDHVNTPSSPYPQSAITPRNNYSATASFEEPQSANPTSGKSLSGRSRKRHGPVVSSAWPASASTPTGKLRGRPPSNRSVQDGPFSTFPANPNTKEAPAINVATPTAPNATSPSPNRSSQSDRGTGTTVSQLKSAAAIIPPHPPTAQPVPTTEQQSLVRKPSKLQLQVPEHSGGPVRLATPPRVLINGESDRNHPGLLHHGGGNQRGSADFFDNVDDESDDDGGGAGMEEEEDLGPGNDNGGGGTVDWRRRANILRRKLQEKEEELRALKKRVLDAVM